MFLMLLSATMIGVVLFKLGVYSALVTMFSAVFKVALIILGITLIVYLYRKLKDTPAVFNLPKRHG